MGHSKALALKLGYTLLLLFAAFGFFGAVWVTDILVTAIIVTGFLYVIGDLWLLPAFGNTAAAVTEAILAALIIWATELILVGFGLPAALILTSTALLGLAEFAFHFYLEKRLANTPPHPQE